MSSAGGGVGRAGSFAAGGGGDDADVLALQRLRRDQDVVHVAAERERNAAQPVVGARVGAGLGLLVETVVGAGHARVDDRAFAGTLAPE